MKSRFCSLYLCFLFLLSGASFGVDFNGPFRQELDGHEDRDPFLYYLPSYDKKQKELEPGWPLIISLHGVASNPYAQNKIFNFKEMSVEKDFILAVPHGSKGGLGVRYWNATDFCCGRNQNPKDDVKYLNDLIDHMLNNYPINPKRVFIVGHSNGGFMAHRLACEIPEKIKGIVSFAGSNFKDFSKCKNKEPISVLQIHGTNDQLVKYHGTAMYPGANEVTEWWKNKNSCSDDSYQEFTMDGFDPLEVNQFSLDYTTSVREWNSCSNKTKTALWTIKNGQHVHKFNADFLTKIVKFLFDLP